MNRLHPLFVDILKAHGLPVSPEAPTDTLRMERYVSALKSHDWQFEFSDDHRVWTRGREQRAHLEAERRVIDPDSRVWREHAPKPFNESAQ